MRMARKNGGTGTLFYRMFGRPLEMLKSSFLMIWRTPIRTALTIAVIAVSLAVPVTLYLLYSNATSVTDGLHEDSRISLYLKRTVTEDRGRGLAEMMKGREGVKSARYISSDEALVEFSKTTGFTEPIVYLAENPRPAVIEIIPDETVSHSAEKARDLLKELLKNQLVEQGKIDVDWIKKLNALASMLRTLTFGLGAMLVLGFILTVANSVRIDLMDRRDEIVVEKLLGATDRFIFGPFMYTSFWYGLLGGLAAWWVNEVFMVCFDSSVQDLAKQYTPDGFDLTFLPVSAAGLMILFSIALSMIAARTALGYVSRSVEPE